MGFFASPNHFFNMVEVIRGIFKWFLISQRIRKENVSWNKVFSSVQGFFSRSCSAFKHAERLKLFVLYCQRYCTSVYIYDWFLRSDLLQSLNQFTLKWKLTSFTPFYDHYNNSLIWIISSFVFSTGTLNEFVAVDLSGFVSSSPWLYYVRFFPFFACFSSHFI